MLTTRIQLTKIAFETLGIYRGLTEDKVLSQLYTLVDYIEENPEDCIGILSRYHEFYYHLMEKGGGCSLKDYIIQKILFHDNAYARLAQVNDWEKICNDIRQAVKQDLLSLSYIASITPTDIQEAMGSTDEQLPFVLQKIMNIPTWNIEENMQGQQQYQAIIEQFQRSSSWEDCVEELARFHRQNGSGIWSKFKGFVWEEDQLQGVVSLDPIRLRDFVGYELERQKVIDNTLAFLQGYPANNILLYGSRGTGKSSTVKALLNEYHSQGLRVIEIPKRYLSSFPKVIRTIKDCPQKFILFIDDLSFEDSEETYTALKAVLEGGLETRPQNVVIYATTNRRHLIKEKFSDRIGLGSPNVDDEIRAGDTMQEKLSLADRFGITVTFIAPNQKKYLEIVDALAESRGLQIEKETLHQKAIQWEMRYNARSPRTAKQFVDWLESNL